MAKNKSKYEAESLPETHRLHFWHESNHGLHEGCHDVPVEFVHAKNQVWVKRLLPNGIRFKRTKPHSVVMDLKLESSK